MERRFDMTNFEQSLKDHADQFTIVPSRKVWYGLYNDLHPGSKWPSIAMGLVFLFSLIGIGHFNNSNQSVAFNHTGNEDATLTTQGIPSNYPDQNQNGVPEFEGEESVQTGSAPVIDLFTGSNIEGSNKNIPTIANNLQSNNYNENIAGNLSSRNVRNPISSIKSQSQYLQLIAGSFVTPEVRGEINPNNDQAKNPVEINPGFAITPLADNKIEGVYTSSVINDELLSGTGIENLPASILPEPGSSTKNHFLSENENKATDLTAKKLAAAKKKRNTNVDWLFYVTPKISSVYFTGKALPGAPNASPLVVRSGQVMENMIYNAKIGFETGTEMQFKFAKKWQLITGAQLSYSGFNIISHRVHPALSTLVLRNEDGDHRTKNYITYFGNGHNENQITLRNYNIQISLPVGVQYEVWGNKNIQVKINSTLQPSLVLKSHGYLLSSDGRNYVEDPDLIRNVNLNTNFGSSVTFRSNNLKWQVGPTLRYQVLSTYKNIYPVREHLIDYGIRIGISK